MSNLLKKGWINKNRPGVVLAPMEGVTDAPMRALLSEHSPYLFCVTEFLRVTHLAPPTKVFYRHIPELKTQSLTANDTPVLVQLLGGDAQVLAEAAQTAVQLGARGIDLNFGCPAPTVNRHDGGATLLKYPKRLLDITSAVRKAVPAEISVSVKLRLGWDNPDDIFKNVDAVLAAGVSWITIHARTRMQGYAPPVSWQHIKEVARQAPVPIVANGDIWNFSDFLRCHEITECKHFMIGRGALGNPWLAHQMTHYLNTGSPPTDLFSPTTPADWNPLIQRFWALGESQSSKPEYFTRRIKQWIKMASLKKEMSWFHQLKHCQTHNETLNLFQSAQ